MGRRYVNQLGEQDSVAEVFRAAEKQLRPNRNGHLYLQLELSDRTGRVSARMWNAGETLYRSFENGDYVRVEGSSQRFQGAMQIILTHLEKVEPKEVNPDDFTPVAAVDVDQLVVRMGELLRGMTNPHLRNLAECFLLDEEFMGKLARAPAGVEASGFSVITSRPDSTTAITCCGCSVCGVQTSTASRSVRANRSSTLAWAGSFSRSLCSWRRWALKSHRAVSSYGPSPCVRMFA